ncbi:hypothetical protein [Actinomadura harenae]|uniref:hypothetical protein n=1 Tax=Actinomadura harenae TaxID=2483351 RepID=UPI0018F2F79C|nr:hypothetical protein [Actinomadura harenae]
MLSDAELTLGLSRHLSAYAMSPAKAALEQLEFCGQVLDMAFRLRKSGTSTPERVNAIANEAGIGPRVLRDAMRTLEAVGWISVQRADDQKPLSVSEAIPAPAGLISKSNDLLRVAVLGGVEYAALSLLRATTLQPLTIGEAKDQALSGTDLVGRALNESDVDDAIRHLHTLALVRKVKTDDGTEVIFNPHIWTDEKKVALAALRSANAKGTEEVAALMEEVGAKPGMPESSVKSTSKKWIDFAVSQGLVHRSVIQTSTGQEQGFLFTPHLNRGPFGATSGDPSGQVRQLVGSMIYAATFAQYRLYNPGAFIQKLIDRGEAGNASPIGTDYPMLETAGIVRVIPGASSNRYRLELLQSDVAEDALSILSDRDGSGSDPNGAAALRAQRSYVHTDRERARLALSVEVDDVEQSRLISALRDEATRRAFKGR